MKALAQADVFRGGFGAVNKFPQAPQLAALLEIQAQTPNAKLAEFLRLSLDRMAGLGLYDHIGGGFFRYTVDPDWHTPHFEKMLYDNAQLAGVYLQAAAVLKQPAYRDTALRTLDFMLEQMRRRRQRRLHHQPVRHRRARPRGRRVFVGQGRAEKNAGAGRVPTDRQILAPGSSGGAA